MLKLQQGNFVKDGGNVNSQLKRDKKDLLKNASRDG
jgi:hypothetical protein